MRKVWSYALVVLALLLALTLAACESGNGNETDAATTGDVTTAAPDTEDTTAPAGDVTPAPDEETTEPETEDEGPAGMPKNNKDITFFQDENAENYLKGTNCDWELVEDAEYGTVLKMTSATGDKAGYPYVKFDYAAYMKSLGMNPANASEAGIVVIKVKAENCTSHSFDLTCSPDDKPRARTTLSVAYDVENDGWQTLIFTLAKEPWKGDVVGSFSLNHGDDIPSGQVVYVQSIRLFKDLSTYCGTVEELKQYELGANSSLKVEANDPVTHVKQDAPDEDASVDLWFDHITEKTVASDITSSGKVGYTIRLAKNDISDCQFFLAPKTDRTFRIELGTLTHENGTDTMDTSVYFTYYHYVGKEDRMPDALPPVQGPMEVKGNTSQGFVIKAKATKETAAGLYSAQLNIYDNETGKHIKTATVYAYVWDFVLTDDTTYEVGGIMGMPSYNALATVDNTEAYKIYFDFFLENRVSPYDLPVDILSDEAAEYIHNPRLQAFRPQWWVDTAALYEKYKDDPIALEKLFFYYFDEPKTDRDMPGIAATYHNMEQLFPGLHVIYTSDFDFWYDESRDAVQFFQEEMDVDIWCPKTNAFTPAEFNGSVISNLWEWQSNDLTEKYGLFYDRIKEDLDEGDKLWVFFCGTPTDKHLCATWLPLGDGVEPVITAWQSKMNGVTGVLNWHMTLWTSDPYEDITSVQADGVCYGDALYAYPGAHFGIDEPVSSIRLEQIREGIEDYEYLTMIEELYGEEVMDEIINLVTTSVIHYTVDDDYLANVRVMLGDMVEAGIKNKA